MENNLKNTLHYSKMMDIMLKTLNGKPAPFSLVYVKKSTGEIVRFRKCRFSSMHAEGGTVNIFKDGETHPVKIRRCLVLYINAFKIYM